MFKLAKSFGSSCKVLSLFCSWEPLQTEIETVSWNHLQVGECSRNHNKAFFWIFLGITIPGCTVLGSQYCVFSQACGIRARTEVRQLFSSSVSSVPRLKLWMKLDKTFYFKKDLLGISGKPLCFRSIIIFWFYPVLFCG